MEPLRLFHPTWVGCGVRADEVFWHMFFCVALFSTEKTVGWNKRSGSTMTLLHTLILSKKYYKNIFALPAEEMVGIFRSEERRVGKEC